MYAHLALLIAIIIVSITLHYIKHNAPKTSNKERYASSSCSLDLNHSCDSLTGAPLHPVNEPDYNLKQVVIQMLLLEDHLFHREKQCSSCIKKHILMIEGLAEEGITLDQGNTYTSTFETILDAMTEVEKIYKKEPLIAGQRIRELRRQFINLI